VFGLVTPPLLFANLGINGRVVRPGGVGASLIGQVRSELLVLFALVTIWISGALAMASDLRGYENCIWDGYYHYPKPSDFNHVCDLINATVNMGYATFGCVALSWFVVTSTAIYILLYLDQDTLTEPSHDMGGRAYRFNQIFLSSLRDRRRPMMTSDQQQQRDLEKGGASGRGRRPSARSFDSREGGPMMQGGRHAPLIGVGGAAGDGDLERDLESPMMSPRDAGRQRLPSFERERPSLDVPRRAEEPRFEGAGAGANDGQYHGYVVGGANPFEQTVEE